MDDGGAVRRGLSRIDARHRRPLRNRKFADSPLERTGFELPVPRRDGWRPAFPRSRGNPDLDEVVEAAEAPSRASLFATPLPSQPVTMTNPATSTGLPRLRPIPIRRVWPSRHG